MSNHLILHAGAEHATLEQVRETATPANTATHFPIPHAALIDTVADAVECSGYRVSSQEFGLYNDGARMFSLWGLENGSAHDDYRLTIGLRNAHDKAFSAGFSIGSWAFVCDNLAFSGDVVIGRKHTRHIMRDLVRLVMEGVGKIGTVRDSQDRRIESYKRTTLEDTQVHDLLIRSVDAQVMANAMIGKVLQEWRASDHEEFSPRTAWSLFNAYTEVFKGTNPFDLTARTTRLHGLLDLVATAEGNDPNQILVDLPDVGTDLMRLPDTGLAYLN